MGTEAIVRAERQEVTPMALLQVAMSQNADIDKLTKLWELQKDWEAHQAKKQFDAAMEEFKKNAPKISKNKHVKFGNTEYDHATLDHANDEIIKALSAVGITHSWRPTQSGAEIAVTCVLKGFGHSEETTLKANPDNSGSKNSIQAIASTTTYLQRYTLLMACGLAAKGVDDDGRSAESIDISEDLEWIANASDLKELEKLYKQAYKKASVAKDKRAQEEIIAAKDARKAELQ